MHENVLFLTFNREKVRFRAFLAKLGNNDSSWNRHKSSWV